MGSLISTPKTPTVQTPEVQAPTPIPDAEDPNKRIKSQKRAAKRISSSGRESTFLTKSDKFGGA